MKLVPVGDSKYPEQAFDIPAGAKQLLSNPTIDFVRAGNSAVANTDFLTPAENRWPPTIACRVAHDETITKPQAQKIVSDITETSLEKRI